ncbi:MAG: hypothetical protein V4858_12520 [Pseudomonadota bacterium]
MKTVSFAILALLFLGSASSQTSNQTQRGNNVAPLPWCSDVPAAQRKTTRCKQAGEFRNPQPYLPSDENMRIIKRREEAVRADLRRRDDANKDQKPKTIPRY